MQRKIRTHPVLQFAPEIKDVCRPLEKLNISYFAHVNIDNNKKFSAFSNHPAFHQHYLEKEYFHADIHLSGLDNMTNYVLWDALECSGESKKMDEDAMAFGIKRSFTIIDKNISGDNFYHFSTHIDHRSFNQVYLSNIDLLKMFIAYFNDTISQSPKLLNAYQVKFDIEENNAHYLTLNDLNNPDMRSNFLNDMSECQSSFKLSAGNKGYVILIHKDTKHVVHVYKQQMRCLNDLMDGLTAKETAAKLNLSVRTVNHYLEHLRNKLGCRTGKELISSYYSQVFQQRHLID